MQIKTKKHFNELIKSMVEQLIDEYELDEITTTAAVPGYSTPFAFSSKKDRKKKKRVRGTWIRLLYGIHSYRFRSSTKKKYGKTKKIKS